ncbi:MAG TPA: lipase secretion chaperone [Kofleriaceae bacterium]|jgi:lipase chaperone LimK|nr:lipase secretion chaperone [Kofleriaceae bacterium]
MRRRGGLVAIIGGCILVGIVGVVLWRGSSAATEPIARPAPGVEGQPAGAGVPAVTRAPAVPPAPPAPDVVPPAALPASLEGTEPDGAVAADATGHLIISLELRRLFDHFLAASGEESIATMRARIIAALRQRLPVVAAAEAIKILDRYLAYRDAARLLVSASSDLVGELDQVHALRAKFFSPAVTKAFFADEEAATYAAIARRDALADPTLSAGERDRRLAEIDARTPAAVREARAAAMAPIDELYRETALRAAGASDQQIATARTAAFGAEAAARLAELDRAHAAWDARLAEFRAERAAVLADPQLDDAARRRRIDELLARAFSPAERVRVEALDRIASSSAAH